MVDRLRASGSLRGLGLWLGSIVGHRPCSRSSRKEGDRFVRTTLVAGALGALLITSASAQESLPRDGSVLPTPDPPFKGKIGETIKDSTPDYPQPVQGRRKARPNVLLDPARRRRLRHVLDVRRAGADAEPRQAREERPEVHPVPHDRALQPDARRAAHRPQPPQRRHRRHHRDGHRLSPATPASSRRARPRSSEMLRDNGYATAMFGKWHNTPEPEISPAGPFDRWPTGLGFDYFYGFNQGETQPVLPDALSQHDAGRRSRSRPSRATTSPRT